MQARSIPDVGGGYFCSIREGAGAVGCGPCLIMVGGSRGGVRVSDSDSAKVAGAAIASAGAAATATAAAACCVPVVSPLLVAAIGASGAAWVTGLKPWAPFLLAGGLLLLLYAFRTVRRVRRCEAGAPPPLRPWIGRGTLLLLGLSALVWIGSVVAYFLTS